VPVLNTYVEIPAAFNGIKVNTSGSLDIYTNGVANDSIQISSTQLTSQQIKSKSIVKLQHYDLYLQNLSYEASDNRVLIRDFVGIVIRKVGQ
jgi:hypothetical protein